MAKLQPVRGTHDLLPEDMRRHRHVGDTARVVASRYGYEEMSTPIFESSEVFKRSLGDTTDIVSKEMYTFIDKGNESITLRPENTAGVVRALLSNSQLQQLPLRYFYWGPMFRFERPQKGRQRQFHQIGIELLGAPEPLGDVEVIATGWSILQALGLGKHITLELNTLGDSASRSTYRDALVGYFRAHQEKLSEDSRLRLERNPLRILDSKDDGDRRVVADAPRFDDHLNELSRAFFARVTSGLDAIGISFTRNARLVRGLDYYSHTAFEFTTTALGAQGTVMGGGRYDGLVEQMGGPATAGVGWAAGVERLAMLLDSVREPVRPVTLVPLGAAAENRALALAEELRHSGFRIDLGFKGDLGRRLKAANRQRAAAAVIIGDNEIARGIAALKDLDSGAQSDVPLAELATHLARYR
jgi:histidyl-tRNA synthetase